MESAEQEVRDLTDMPDKPKQVHRLSRDRVATTKHPQQASGPPTGYRCGSNHKATDCPLKDAVCHFCRKKRHMAAVCKAKQRQQGKKKSQPNSGSGSSPSTGTSSSSGTNLVQEVESETPEGSGTNEQSEAAKEYGLYYTHPKGNPSFIIDVHIN